MEWITGFAQDIRHTLRGFARRPGFTAIAFATLALGIGATTAIFSFVQGILLEPLPYEQPEELVAVYQDYRERGYPEREVFSYRTYLDYRERSRTLDDLAVGRGWLPTLTGLDETTQLQGARYSHSYLDLLGVRPHLGRTLRPGEEGPEAPRVALVSYTFWQQRMAADPEAVGTTLTLDGEPWTVVGVLPAEFRAPVGADPDIVGPLLNSPTSSRGILNLSALGRLAEGASLESARAELASIAAALAAEHEEQEGVGSAVYPLHSEMTRNSRSALWVLLGAVALLLVIACANVGNLVLTRTLGRRGEIAVRSALGAGRGRLIRQLLTESLLLAVGGGLAGLLIAWLGVDLLQKLVPTGLAVPRLNDVAVHPGVAAFAVGVALLSGLLLGLAPAFQASRPDLDRPLRDECRSTTSRGGRRVRGAFVMVQAALALVLLVGSALLLRSFLELTRVDPGFRTENLLTFNVALPRAEYPSRDQVRHFYDALQERLEALPGVESTAGISNLPLGPGNTDTGFQVVGRETANPADAPTAWYQQVTTGYFQAMGLRLLEGRGFEPRDHADAPLVVVVNETFERRYFPQEDVLGQRIRTGDRVWEIVGKVANTRHFGLATEEPPAVYLAHTQVPSGFLNLMVRTAGDPLDLAPAVRRLVAELDPNLAAAGLTTMDEVVAGAAAPERALSFLIGLFGLLALGVAAVGLYAVVAYAAGQRTREIGIRMALGARAGSVLHLVLGHGLRLALTGLAVGVVVAMWGSRWLEDLLFGIDPLDPTAYLVSVGLLTTVALLASWLPARRAARLDPMRALRS